jgi:hypothetical protein
MLSSKGYQPKIVDTSNKEVQVPEEADLIRFIFTKDGKKYGPVDLTIEGNSIVIYLSDGVLSSPDFPSPGSGYDDSWNGLRNHIRSWGHRFGLGLSIKNQDHLQPDMAKRHHMKTNKIAEGYYPMGKQASYNDSVPNVKIVIQHTRKIEEGEQRFRNVEKIFIENTVGERILAPTLRPGVARIYARHIAEGGLPHDDRWKHLSSLVEEYTKMAGFVRATRAGQFNESAQKLVNEGINHYLSLRESLGKMTGHRGYNAYFEAWSPALMEEQIEEANLNELFVQETLDPRIENVLPILSKLHKKVNEMSEVTELAEWADRLIGEDESLTSNNPVAIPEQDMAGGESNREMWDRVRSRGVVPGIDREKYTERPGLEGPFSTKFGKVVYYDPKEGKYYDPGTDFYISHDDYEAMNETGVAEGGAKDRQWSNKDMERLRVATRDFDDIMASDGPDQDKHDLIKKRIQTKPMAGPKGQLPEEQGVAEGKSDYKIKSIGTDSKGDYYISPSTGKKVYKSGVKKGDHENPKTGEHKGVTEDPITGAIIGGLAGAALGGKGAWHAGKKAAERDFDIAEPSTLKVAGRYVKDFAKGIIDPRTYIPKKKDVAEGNDDLARILTIMNHRR